MEGTGSTTHSLERIFQKYFYFLEGTTPFLVLHKEDSCITIQMPQAKRRKSKQLSTGTKYKNGKYTFTGRKACILNNL